MTNNDIDEREIIIETIKVGNYVKVSAIEPVTKTEVCIVCPNNTSEFQQIKLVLQKLRYVLRETKKKKSPA